MDEYPKVIVVGGVTITATDAADEARWRADVDASNRVAAAIDHESVPMAVEPEPERAPVTSLDDVTLEMDNPKFQPPTKRTSAKKK